MYDPTDLLAVDAPPDQPVDLYTQDDYVGKIAGGIVTTQQPLYAADAPPVDMAAPDWVTAVTAIGNDALAWFKAIKPNTTPLPGAAGGQGVTVYAPGVGVASVSISPLIIVVLGVALIVLLKKV